MPAHVKVSSTWKALTGLHTKVGSTWKEIKNGYIKVGSSWKNFYTSAEVILRGSSGSPITDFDFETFPTDAAAGWSFQSSGDLTKASGAAYNQPEWYGSALDTTHQTPDQTYYIRATLDSGVAPSTGPALNTWLSLASSRAWVWSQSGLGTTEGTLKIEIASDALGTDIVATGYYEGSAEVEP